MITHGSLQEKSGASRLDRHDHRHDHTDGNKKHREENDERRRFPGHYWWIDSYNEVSLQNTPSAWGAPFP
jgi:hypothetical protein